MPFIGSADQQGPKRKTEGHDSGLENCERTTLVEQHTPQELSTLLDLDLPEAGQSKVGFLEQVQQILKYSVNTWDAGFLSKLYSSTDAPGLASELLLAALNTNVHTYEVSPVLALIEKHTARALAKLFGLDGLHAGGISVQGGSSSNTTAIVIARNTLFPDTKIHGNISTGKLILFTSAHGHYSISKAAQMLGLGSSSVRTVIVDPVTGQMDPSALASSIVAAKAAGEVPFFLNATAGTTVLGSYDSIPALASICKEHRLWLHIDASWGGPAIFSSQHKYKLQGSHLADSITINPHKMMGVPITCSFLLGADMKLFHKSNTLPANYLFHGDPSDTDEVYDLADLTLQCGRRGDALKLYLAWVYHGSQGFAAQIDCAFETGMCCIFSPPSAALSCVARYQRPHIGQSDSITVCPILKASTLVQLTTVNSNSCIPCESCLCRPRSSACGRESAALHTGLFFLRKREAIER